MYHEPVLLEESINGLNIIPSGTYVDVTFGGGGHSRAILEHLTDGKLIAFDQDEDTRVNIIKDNRFMLINANYRYMKNFLRYHHAIPVDGILADLGVSSHQIDTPERGFSTRFDGELNLRMDRYNPLNAQQVINHYPEDQLQKVFSLYGEIENASKLSATIVRHRQQLPITTTAILRDIVFPLAPRGKEHQYLAKIFQALRIEVNQELEALKTLLVRSADVLREGGRLVVIAYHSLEDRLVKNFLRSGNFEGRLQKDFYGNIQAPFRPVNKKPITASDKEVAANPRSRSARLRIAEKC